MMTLGDIVSQQAVEKRGLEGHDFKRSFRMTVYGALIGGPVIGTWFGFINRVITIKNKWAGKSLLISHTGSRIFIQPIYFYSDDRSSWH